MNETMTVLVLGATGATGRLLTQQLLDRGLKVKAIVCFQMLAGAVGEEWDAIIDGLKQSAAETSDKLIGNCRLR